MIRTKSKFAAELKRFGLIFMPINWGICLIVTITLLLVFKDDNSYALGYLLGSVTSYLTFGLHMKDVNDYGSEKANIIMKIFTNIFTRLAITAIVLVIAYFNNTMFRFVTTAIGILVIKLFLIIFGIFYAKMEHKKPIEENINNSGEEVKEEDDKSSLS